MGQDGVIEITQISGTKILRIDGESIGERTRARTVRIPAMGSATLTVGGSRLRITSTTDPQVAALGQSAKNSRWAAQGLLATRVVREPRVREAPPSPRLVAPPEVVPNGVAAPLHTLIAAGIALCAGLVMAVVLGHMMFAAFALMGAFTAASTWGVGRIRHSRQVRSVRLQNQRADRELLAEMIAVAQQIESHLHRCAPELSAVGVAQQIGALWSRRPTHGDAMDVTLGLHDTRVPITVEPESGGAARPQHQRLVEDLAVMGSVPEVMSLDDPANERVAVTGPVAPEVMRSILAQIAVGTGPADLRIVAVTADPSHYAWLTLLPHCANSDLSGSDSRAQGVIDCRDQPTLIREMTGLDDGDPRRLLIVTDVPEMLTLRTGPVRRLLDINRPITLLVEIGTGVQRRPSDTADGDGHIHTLAPSHQRAVPAVCTAVILTNTIDSLGISERTALGIAREMSGLEDPEDVTQQAHSLPHRVDLRSLINGCDTPEEIRAGWTVGGADPAPAGVIGVTADAILEIDLVADGPHGLVAGTTGSGKSELLRSLVISLALRVSPEHLQFVLIDYKGGSTFDACADLPHTVGLVTDLDEGLAERALISLNAEIHRRERILRSFGSGDLRAYRAHPDAPPLARLVVVIDEFAALAHELPGFLASLVGIAQRGRSLGMHVILATQRPAGVIDDAIRANTDLRIALRLNDTSDARDVAGDDRPVGFPRGVPGRSLMRLGADDAVVFQAASSAVILRTLVERICEASTVAGHHITHRPWLPSLDEVMERIDVSSERGEITALGVVDNPAAQAHHDLSWDRSGGLVLIGAPGSGTTSTLLRIIDHLVHTDAAVVFVIDAAGDPKLAPVDAAPNCVGVIGVHDRERIEKLLHRWSEEIDKRQSSGRGRTGFAEWVLAIDGLMAVRRNLDDLTGSTLLATLDRVLAEGPPMGLVTVATVESGGGAAATMVNRFATRWIHHLDDPSEGGLYGVSSAAVPPPIPGRIFMPSAMLWAQVYPPEMGCRTQGYPQHSHHEIQRIEVLPPLVLTVELERIAEVGAARNHNGPLLNLLIGVGSHDLHPARMEVSRGDHVMVLGPARSGRSLTAVQIARSWRRLHPEGTMLMMCGRRGVNALLSSGAVGEDVAIIDSSDLPNPAELTGALLVIVDDAERVDDASGRLAGLIDSGHPDVLVVAVARPDALRGVYGHWTAAIRRSKTGVIMAAAGDLDGDLLSVMLPRRCPIRARPGLAWIVDAGGLQLVQVALNQPDLAVSLLGQHVSDHTGP